MDPSTPSWLTLADAALYASGDSRTEKGHVLRIGARLLAKQVKAGRLRACVIGGRKQILTRRDWIDAWILDQAAPIVVPTRRRA